MTDDNQHSWKNYFWSSINLKYLSAFGVNKGRYDDQKPPQEVNTEKEPKSWKETVYSGLDGAYGFVKSNVVKHIGNESKAQETTKMFVEGLVKGGKVFYYLEGQYLNFKITPTLKILVSDARMKSKILFRLDHPHPGANFNHVNINPKAYNLARDPHFRLPPGSRHVGYGITKTTQVLNQINEWIVPIAIVVDVTKVAFAVKKDYDNSSSRNTAETCTKIACGWTGGALGAKAGACIGSLILPGPATIIFGITGAVLGSVHLTAETESIFKKIADKYGYNIEIKNCLICQENVEALKHQGEEKKICDPCVEQLTENPKCKSKL